MSKTILKKVLINVSFIAVSLIFSGTILSADPAENDESDIMTTSAASVEEHEVTGEESGGSHQTTSLQPYIPRPYFIAFNLIADAPPLAPALLIPGYEFPGLYAGEGWFSVSNHDYQPYFIGVDMDKREITLTTIPVGGFAIADGESFVINIKAGDYKLCYEGAEPIAAHIEENNATTLSLYPFGVWGNNGLLAVLSDTVTTYSQILSSPNFFPTTKPIIENPPYDMIGEVTYYNSLNN